MAIYLCKACDYMKEVSSQYINKRAKCLNCHELNEVLDTIELIKSLKSGKPNKISSANHSLLDNTTIDLSKLEVTNTDAFSSDENIKPIQDWFQTKNIKITTNKATSDTTGFFDEIALMMGASHDVLSYVTNQIKYLQNKGYKNVKILLKEKSADEIQKITSFCQKLYDFSFVSRYSYNKKEKIIRMLIQPSSAIRHFFNGEWLEWYIFISLIQKFKQKNIPINILRSVQITLPNSEKFELDVFLLIDNRIPFLIECKSGEFRADIQKYVNLKKHLKLDSTSFFLFALDLDNTQTQGLSAMYDITFINNDNYIEKILDNI